jgi:transposase
MRGEDRQQVAMFSYISVEQRVPQEHPLRVMWVLSDAVLKDLSRKFSRLYSHTGRPSIPPEKLLRALLLQVLYSIRSERLLMEQLHYNLLFRWFVGLDMDDAVWDPTVFTKNRDRLLQGDIAQAFFNKVLALATEHQLMSDEHFTVDGTLIEAWAGQKSFQRKDRSGPPPRDPEGGGVDFHGERRSNETHESTTDPEARLYRKSYHGAAKLSYLGHLLMENRNGLVVDARLTQATGRAEREAALEMVRRRKSRSSLGADKAYDTRDFVAAVRARKLVAHVAQNTKNRRSAIDRRTTRHRSYLASQWCRHRIEPIFGWLKTVGRFGKTRHRGVKRVGWMFTFSAAVYNLVRIRNLVAAPG